MILLWCFYTHFEAWDLFIDSTWKTATGTLLQFLLLCSMEERMPCGWINMVNKWCQNFNVWLNYPFKRSESLISNNKTSLYYFTPSSSSVSRLSTKSVPGRVCRVWHRKGLMNVFWKKKKHPQSSAKERGKNIPQMSSEFMSVITLF